MVGVSLTSQKKLDGKEISLQTNDVIIIPIKGEENEDFTFDEEYASEKRSTIILFCMILFMVIGCVTLGMWYTWQRASEINQRWQCPYHSKNALMDSQIDFHRENWRFHRGTRMLAASFSTPMNIGQNEAQQKFRTNFRNAEEITEIPFLSPACVIKKIDHNITIIFNYDTSKCYIIPFDLRCVQKPANMYGTVVQALFGPSINNTDAIVSTLAEDELAEYAPEMIGTCVQTFLVIPKPLIT